MTDERTVTVMPKPEILYIVVPCYNEEAALPDSSKKLGSKLKGLISDGRVSSLSRVLFVDDGSKDGTWGLVQELHASGTMFSGLRLSRNRGHQNALMAGLMYARGRCDVSISIDADLQDDLGAIDGMLDQHFNNGCDVVYGVRSSRKSDTAFKKFTAEGFYKILAAMGCEVVFNHADFRLMSKRALDGLAEFPEYNLFLRGLVPMVGYKSGTVEYARSLRLAGESKYPLKKMLALAMNGVVGLSVKPLRLVLWSGCGIFGISLASMLCLLAGMGSGGAVPWLIASVWACCGLVLTGLGIVGEYVGQLCTESKHRPRYIVQEVLDEDT
ncbi:MAG: glycosyltransferase family 2 protein [Muribaculaceae bacterium]|nr:glycosyltransferase family 2 protein [Muribaculaceae bacterium]